MAVTTKTARDVINRALKDILVQESEADLEPDEYADALDALNDMMADIVGDGVVLNPVWTRATGLSFTLTVDEACIRGIQANLALELAPMFSRPITPELRNAADKGMRTLQRFGHAVIETRFPGTLPVGSGNYDNTFNDDHFYADQNDGILNGTIT